MSRAGVLPDERLLVPLRARVVPVASTIMGSMLAALPYVGDAPLLPPFGLLMLLGWRLLRPELWQAWVALPLGLFDDLMSGQPLGSGMTLWTIVLLTLDLSENRSVWHDYWHDLLNSAIALGFCLFGGWAVVAFTSGAGNVLTVLPQLAFAILAMPMAIRIVAKLDRYRLTR
jgi:rod shape-determining protein MreD